VNAPRQPILETLSEAEKDALILRLWDDLREERARSQALEQGLRPPEGKTTDGAGASALLAQLRERGTDKPSPTLAPSRIRIGLGSGFDCVRPKAVLGAIAFVVLVFGLDLAIDWYQRHRLEEKRIAALQLQHAAYADLYVEVTNVAYEPDG